MLIQASSGQPGYEILKGYQERGFVFHGSTRVGLEVLLIHLPFSSRFARLYSSMSTSEYNGAPAFPDCMNALATPTAPTAFSLSASDSILALIVSGISAVVV